MGFAGTTVGQCRYLLEMLDEAVEVKDKAAYDEAVSGLKNLQFLFSQSLARENMWAKRLQEKMSLGDAAFFRAMFLEMEEADRIGAENYFKEMGAEDD